LVANWKLYNRKEGGGNSPQRRFTSVFDLAKPGGYNEKALSFRVHARFTAAHNVKYPDEWICRS